MRHEQQQKRLRQLRANAKRRSPGSSPKGRYHTQKALNAIADRTDHYLSKFEGSPSLALWPFENVVTTRDEDLMPDRFAILNRLFSEDIEPDELTWHVRAYQDLSIKASNVIEVVSWYKGIDDYDDLVEMLIVKPIYSPLPCPTWGALPLTLAQWCSIAKTLSVAHMRHQWVQAVRFYTNNESMQVGGCGGWTMKLSNKVQSHEEMKANGTFLYSGNQQERTEPWIGHIIYSDIIEQYSKLNEGT